MNEPTPAAPFALTPMTIEQVEALARQLIPVPIGALIIGQTLQTCHADRANIVRWSISHFKPNNCNQCTQSEGETPLEALSLLIRKLTPCDSSTPFAYPTTPPPAPSGEASITSPLTKL